MKAVNDIQDYYYFEVVCHGSKLMEKNIVNYVTD